MRHASAAPPAFFGLSSLLVYPHLFCQPFPAASIRFQIARLTLWGVFSFWPAREGVYFIYKGNGCGFEHTKFLSGPGHSFKCRMYRHPERRFGLVRKPLYKKRPHPHAGAAMFYSTDKATREPAISSMTAGAVRKGAGRWMLSVRP